MLTLVEELFLLALDDEEEKVSFSGPRYASAGAILLDLVVAERITLSGKHLVVMNGAVIDNALQNRALSLMLESNKPRDPKHWVRTVAGAIKDMDEQVSEGLLRRGIIRREEHKILWVFPTKRYPLVEDDVQDSVIDRVRAALVEGTEPDRRTRALIGLGNAADLLKHALTKDERKATHKHVDILIAADPLIAAIAKAVKAAADEDAAAASISITTTAAVSS